jgi:hypothetical protein
MWTKCSERQPELPAWYLVAIVTRWGGHMVLMGYYFLNGKWMLDDGAAEASSAPIYWQQIPELPEGL